MQQLTGLRPSELRKGDTIVAAETIDPYGRTGSAPQFVGTVVTRNARTHKGLTTVHVVSQHRELRVVLDDRISVVPAGHVVLSGEDRRGYAFTVERPPASQATAIVEAARAVTALAAL